MFRAGRRHSDIRYNMHYFILKISVTDPEPPGACAAAKALPAEAFCEGRYLTQASNLGFDSTHPHFLCLRIFLFLLCFRAHCVTFVHTPGIPNAYLRSGQRVEGEWRKVPALLRIA